MVQVSTQTVCSVPGYILRLKPPPISILASINPVLFQNVFTVLFVSPFAGKQYVNSPKACRIISNNVFFSRLQKAHTHTISFSEYQFNDFASQGK